MTKSAVRLTKTAPSSGAITRWASATSTGQGYALARAGMAQTQSSVASAMPATTEAGVRPSTAPAAVMDAEMPAVDAGGNVRRKVLFAARGRRQESGKRRGGGSGGRPMSSASDAPSPWVRSKLKQPSELDVSPDAFVKLEQLNWDWDRSIQGVQLDISKVQNQAVKVSVDVELHCVKRGFLRSAGRQFILMPERILMSSSHFAVLLESSCEDIPQVLHYRSGAGHLHQCCSHFTSGSGTNVLPWMFLDVASLPDRHCKLVVWYAHHEFALRVVEMVTTKVAESKIILEARFPGRAAELEQAGSAFRAAAHQLRVSAQVVEPIAFKDVQHMRFLSQGEWTRPVPTAEANTILSALSVIGHKVHDTLFPERRDGEFASSKATPDGSTKEVSAFGSGGGVSHSEARGLALIRQQFCWEAFRW
jgi:hypothetical protein